MPQQINLCTPVLMAEKHLVSARTMGQMLLLLVVMGGTLVAYGVGSWNRAAQDLRVATAAHQPELARLSDALARQGAQAAGAADALNRQLEEQRAFLEARQRVLADSRRGLHVPGQGHAAYLRLVARNIPAQAWVTEIEVDSARLELRGFTLEPASLNDWIVRLRRSPLLEGQPLGTVRVEHVDAPLRRGGLRAGGAAVLAGGSPPAWAFTLSIAVPPVLAGKP